MPGTGGFTKRLLRLAEAAGEPPQNRKQDAAGANPHTANSKHNYPVAKNLINRDVVSEPNRIWVADITYIPTDEVALSSGGPGFV